MHYKAYIILVHQNPKQLDKLIQLLQGKHTVFFIHLDNKVDIASFKYLEGDKVFFVNNRVVCHWGGFSLVKATYNALTEAHTFLKKQSITSYHCLLISGQDLPLKSPRNIDQFLNNNKETSFFYYWQLPYDNWWDGGMFRVTKLYLFNVRTYKKLNERVQKIIIFFGLKRYLPLNRLKAIDKEFKVYGSSQWFVINHDALNALMKHKNIYNKLVKAFRFSFAPDELFFISFYKYIQENERLHIENKATTHVVFEGADPNPKFLEVKDLQSPFENHTLFARKFDKKINIEAIQTVEKRIEH